MNEFFDSNADDLEETAEFVEEDVIEEANDDFEESSDEDEDSDDYEEEDADEEDEDDEDEDADDDPDVSAGKGRKRKPTKEEKKDFAWAKIKARARAAEKKAVLLEKKLQEQAASAARETNAVRPTIPPYPNALEADFDEKVKARDAAIVAAANFDKEQEALAASKKIEQDQLVERSKQQVAANAQEFAKRAAKLGIKPAAMRRAEVTVASVLADGNREVAAHLLKDEQGPLIVNYLFKNPLVLDKLADMDTISAAVFVETKIKPRIKAKGLGKAKPRAQQRVPGSGVATEKDNPFLKGAKIY